MYRVSVNNFSQPVVCCERCLSFDLRLLFFELQYDLLTWTTIIISGNSEYPLISAGWYVVCCERCLSFDLRLLFSSYGVICSPGRL